MMCSNSLIFLNLLLLLCFFQFSVSSRLKRKIACKTDEFQCNSGDCISEFLICDGILDCDDGSDETLANCENTKCPPYLYRCAYGACINKNSRCNGIKDCIDGSDEIACHLHRNDRDIKAPGVGCTLPTHPVGGSFKSLNTASYTPGGIVPPYTIIEGVCNEGYVEVNKAPYYCNDKNKWNDDIPAEYCVAQHTSESGDVSIPKPIECGKPAGTGEYLTKEYPWVVAVYKESQYICGGSIIAANFVLSAAHCFIDNNGRVVDKNQYTIFAGIIYRDHHNPKNWHKQTSKIKHMLTHEYIGVAQNYANDIVLVELETPLKFSDYVRPVCVDWTNEYTSDDLREDNPGFIAAWSTPTQPEGSDILEKTVLPFRTRNVCLKYLPVEFGQRYFTFDKFCAGFTGTEQGICRGDGGSGMYFQSPNDKFYIRGVVSLAPRLEDTHCFPLALFTNVSRHLEWIKDAKQ